MKINKYIDHTILKPEATPNHILQLCHEAVEFGFAAVCVNASYTHLASTNLQGSGVKTCSVIGFPLGSTTTETKVFEAQEAIKHGATELDMVLRIGALKSGDLKIVGSDIAAVVNASKGYALVKVILETCLLTPAEIVEACKISKLNGADFVKTSTGFNSGGATIEHIRLMRQTVGDSMKIKASGGIKTYQQAIALIQAGADRLGMSSSVQIMQEQAQFVIE